MVKAGDRSVDVPDRVRVAWETHHERVWRAVLVWSGDNDVAQDSVAEAFAQVLRRGGDVLDVGAWVWRASFRIAGGLLAERRRHDQIPEGAIQAEAALPDDVVALGECLGRLSERDRTVVVLSLVAGWSSAEIAELTGSSPGAVRVRLHRSRSTLRKCLEETDG